MSEEKPNGHAKQFPVIDHPSRRLIALNNQVLRMHNDLLAFVVSLHRAMKHLDDRLERIEKAKVRDGNHHES